MTTEQIILSVDDKNKIKEFHTLFKSSLKDVTQFDGRKNFDLKFGKK